MNSEEAKQKDKEWENETRRRWMLLKDIGYSFTPTENQGIADFITLAETLEINAVEESEIN